MTKFFNVFPILILWAFAAHGAADITITGNTLDVNGGILSAVNGITVSGGTLQIDIGGVVELGSGATLLINGGTLYTDGTNDVYPQATNNKAQITNTGGTTTWTLTATSGTVDLTGFLIDWLDVNGLNIGGTTQINHLDGGQLRNLSQTYASVKAIEISTTGSIPATATNFGWNWGPTNTPPAPAAAYQLANSTGCSSQTITFNQWFGDFFQGVYNPDPQSKVTEANCTIIISAAASPVDILNFTATAFQNLIRLDWQTGLALGHQGFNVYKSLNASTGFVQINSSLVKAIPGGTTSHGVYIYNDSNVQKGVRYYYKIEDVSTINKKTMFGPVNATLPLKVIQAKKSNLRNNLEPTLGLFDPNGNPGATLDTPADTSLLGQTPPGSVFRSVSSKPPLKIGPLVTGSSLGCNPNVYSKSTRASMASNSYGQAILVWQQQQSMCFQISTPKGITVMGFVPPTMQYGTPDKPRVGINSDGTGIAVFDFSGKYSPVIGVVFNANTLKFGESAILSTYSDVDPIKTQNAIAYTHDVLTDINGNIYAYWGTAPNISYWSKNLNLTPTPADLTTYWWSDYPNYQALSWTQSTSDIDPTNVLAIPPVYQISTANYSCSYGATLLNPGGSCSAVSSSSVAVKYAGGTIKVENDKIQPGCPLVVRNYNLTNELVGEPVVIKNSYFGSAPALDVNSSGQGVISWVGRLQGPNPLFTAFFDAKTGQVSSGLPLIQSECSNYNLPWGNVYSAPSSSKVKIDSEGQGKLVFSMGRERIGLKDSEDVYGLRFNYQKQSFSKARLLTPK